MLEVLPPWIRNGQRLTQEPQHEGLLWVLLHIEDIGDALLQVLVFGHGADHCHDGLIHWIQGLVALLGTARPCRGGSDARRPSFFIVLL